MALLLTDQPYHAYARIAQAFYPMPRLEGWTAPNAVVDAGAIIGEGCRIEWGAVIGPGVEIGRNCHIGANAVIGAGVVIGDDGIIGANATISHAIIGRRAFIYPGVRIGQDGFGFAMSPLGHLKVPQLGRVIIHDDVEIGANTTIDRGAGPDTVIGAGCRIDNLVQIGHNVQLGRGCVIVAQVGISGSTRLDDFVAIGGQVGIGGHLRIGTGAQVAAQSGVMRDVPAGKTMCGSPAIDARDYWRQTVVLSQLAKTKSRS
ncbi:MAG: UDP-3-O-(3-hydroxymyristoyl)glucosamine N-acyltransferase, partial [Rhodospirillales bacterium]|nr:UDP-3-O-(3-hydroxymyristoyl)glucosamine N-acyltransferase [Rhodospirillales bacterium]